MNYLNKIQNKIHELTGKKFGKLTVLKRIGKYNKSVKWLCLCDCGNEKEVTGGSLTQGTTTSCGCFRSELSKTIVGSIKESFIREGTDITQLDRRVNKNNTSGHKGVAWSKSNKKWRSSIMFKRKQIHLGYFEKIEDAIHARKRAEEEYFKPLLKDR